MFKISKKTRTIIGTGMVLSGLTLAITSAYLSTRPHPAPITPAIDTGITETRTPATNPCTVKSCFDSNQSKKEVTGIRTGSQAPTNTTVKPAETQKPDEVVNTPVKPMSQAKTAVVKPEVKATPAPKTTPAPTQTMMEGGNDTGQGDPEGSIPTGYVAHKVSIMPVETVHKDNSDVVANTKNPNMKCQIIDTKTNQNDCVGK